MTQEIGWLIEFPAQGVGGIEGCKGVERASWWIGDDELTAPRATHDSLEAVRFARRQDAEKIISASRAMRQRGAIATEHAWGLP